MNNAIYFKDDRLISNLVKYHWNNARSIQAELHLPTSFDIVPVTLKIDINVLA